MHGMPITLGTLEIVDHTGGGTNRMRSGGIVLHATHGLPDGGTLLIYLVHGFVHVPVAFERRRQ